MPPLNLVGDFGGGSLFLVMGLLAALHAAQSSGAGQVVDAAIVDGVASLTASVHAMRSLGGWGDERADNLLDGARPITTSTNVPMVDSWRSARSSRSSTPSSSG